MSSRSNVPPAVSLRSVARNCPVFSRPRSSSIDWAIAPPFSARTSIVFPGSSQGSISTRLASSTASQTSGARRQPVDQHVVVGFADTPSTLFICWPAS